MTSFSKKEYEAVEEFSKLSLSKLRQYQIINEQHTKLVFEKDDPDLQRKMAALLRVQGMADILAAAVDKKCFG